MDIANVKLVNPSRRKQRTRFLVTYKVNILTNADDDLAWFRQNDRTSYLKCFDLVRDVAKNPRIGLGKPE